MTTGDQLENITSTNCFTCQELVAYCIKMLPTPILDRICMDKYSLSDRNYEYAKQALLVACGLGSDYE